MTHILRIDEMAVRFADKINTGASKSKSKDKFYKNVEKRQIKQAQTEFNDIIKTFPQKDVNDAIDTFNYVLRKYNNNLPKNLYIGDTDTHSGTTFLFDDHVKYGYNYEGLATYTNGYANKQSGSNGFVVSFRLESDSKDSMRCYLIYDRNTKKIDFYYGHLSTFYKDYYKDYSKNEQNIRVDNGNVEFRFSLYLGHNYGSVYRWVNEEELLTKLKKAISDVSDFCKKFFNSVEQL